MVAVLPASYRRIQLRRELKAGVAGAGVFGGYHAEKYAALNGVKLVAIYDVDPARAAAAAARFESIPFTDYEAFLKAVDIATIASPAKSHFSLAEAAIVAGKHILVEKPLTLDLEEADRLNMLASEKELVVQVGHQERFVFEAFGIVTRKRKPLSVACVRRNPATGRGEDVSVVIDLMIHDLDLMRRLDLGSVVSLSAEGSADDVVAEIGFSSGCSTVLAASRRAPARERVMKLVYDDGVVEIDFINRRIDNTTPAPLAATFEEESPEGILRDPLGYGVSRFVKAVRGEAPPVVTGVEGREALEWALLVEDCTVRNQSTQNVRALA